MPQIGEINTLKLGQFYDTYLGKNLYELSLRLPAMYIEQTGSNVVIDLSVPFPHRLQRIEIKHTDASNVDSVVPTALTVAHSKNSLLFFTIVKHSTLIATDLTEEFGEDYSYAESIYRFTTNTTNTHRIYVKFYVQKLSGEN